MNVRPLGDRIIVEPVAAETEVNGIILPDVAQERPSKAVVVAVGPGSRDQNGVVHAPGVAKGDTILFSKFGGQPLEHDGNEYLILREGDVLGVFDED